MYSEVTDDLFGIAERLKDINREYRVFRNARDDRYEVHTSVRPNGLTIGFVVPYGELDERTIEYARRTRKENADVIEKEVALHNRKLTDTARRRFENLRYGLEDMIRYAARAGHSVHFTKKYIKEF